MNKYNAKKVIVDGEVFDSQAEYDYWLELQDKAAKGEISNLQRQIEYILLPRQVDKEGKFKYHPIKYKADFEYADEAGIVHTVDFKGMVLDIFKLKQKLFYYVYGRELEVVKKNKRAKTMKKCDQKKSIKA